MTAVAENRTIVKTADGRQLIVAEQTTWAFSATLIDEAGSPVALAALSTLTLTLYNRDSTAQEIINLVSDVDILNTGRGVLHATSGLLTVTLLPADNVIIDATKDLEWHRALIEGTYAAGAKAFKHECEFQVRNLSKVS